MYELLNHPSGMLDRDQRTALIIDRKEPIYNSYIKNSRDNKKFIFNKKFNNDCDKFTLISERLTLNIPTNSDVSCTSQDLCDVKKIIYKNNKCSYNLFIKKRKLNSFLLCIYFWLLILQKIRATPLKMINDNWNSGSTLKCSVIRDALDKILHQAKISYEINLGKLDNYTLTVFNESHENQHNTWRKSHIPWLFPNNERLPIEEYDKEVPDEVVHHLISIENLERENIATELINLYTRLRILDMTIESIREEHQQNEHTLMNDYPGERYAHMVDFFTTQYNYIRALLRETESSMEQLGVKQPLISNPIQPYERGMDLKDWIVTREHLKLLNYVLRAFDILLKKCS